MIGLWVFGKAWSDFKASHPLQLAWCSPHENHPKDCAHLHPMRYVVLQIDALGGVK